MSSIIPRYNKVTDTNLEPDGVSELDARARTAYLKAFHRRVKEVVTDPAEDGEPDDEMMVLRD